MDVEIEFPKSHGRKEGICSEPVDSGPSQPPGKKRPAGGCELEVHPWHSRGWERGLGANKVGISVKKGPGQSALWGKVARSHAPLGRSLQGLQSAAVERPCLVGTTCPLAHR